MPEDKNTTDLALEAITAPQAEAEGVEKLPITWEGFDMEIVAAAEDWDADTLEAFEIGKPIQAVRGLIGSQTYDGLKAHFRAKHDRPIRVKDVAELMDVIAKAAGFEAAGN